MAWRRPTASSFAWAVYFGLIPATWGPPQVLKQCVPREALERWVPTAFEECFVALGPGGLQRASAWEARLVLERAVLLRVVVHRPAYTPRGSNITTLAINTRRELTS